MIANRRRDTTPELALRRELHRRGLRFRVDHPAVRGLACRIDIAFTRARVAVFVDGCFWHRCPEHGNLPRANGEWWARKLDGNVERDRRNDTDLTAAGWRVMRVWEHEPIGEAADRICAAVSPPAAQTPSGGGCSMPDAGGSLHPTRDDGHVLDATFELHAVAVFELIYHHKVGGQRAINADYHEGLELLLARIASVGAAILGISVDSGVARKLKPEQRELPLDFPIEIDHGIDAYDLRLEITRAVRAIARRPDAKPGGGNDRKRIKITFTLDRPLTPHEAEQLLIERTPPTSR